MKYHQRQRLHQRYHLLIKRDEIFRSVHFLQSNKTLAKERLFNRSQIPKTTIKQAQHNPKFDNQSTSAFALPYHIELYRVILFNLIQFVGLYHNHIVSTKRALFE